MKAKRRGLNWKLPTRTYEKAECGYLSQTTLIIITIGGRSNNSSSITSSNSSRYSTIVIIFTVSYCQFQRPMSSV